MKTKIVLLTVLFACGIAAAEEPVPYANDFTTRTSGATPSDRWMETSYIPGALVRSVSGIASEGREPYNSATAYQDGWAMKTGYCRSSVLFTVADDGGNQAALVNANSSSYQSTTVAMQPFYNEFTDGVLKISVDIRTPAQTASLNPGGNAFALCGPVYKSTLDVAASTFSSPMYFGPASLYDDRGGKEGGEGKPLGWFLRAVSRGRNTADASATYYGQYDSRNDIAAGSWMRYEAVIDLDAGTYTATFANLGTAHPTPATAGGSAVDFRRWEGTGNVPTTFSFVNPLTERTGGIAGLAFYVQGIKQATDAADAPMFDNIAVSWKAPGASDFAPAYENDFSTRRYRQIEPAGTTTGAYVPVLTTNIVQSSFYERANINNDYGVSEGNARRLVPDGAPYAGQDGWRRIAGTAPFTMVDPNKDSTGYGWNNASVLRATKSGTTGMVAVPIGTTVSSGKVRLYCDILMGALTNSTSNGRDIGAAAFLAGDRAYTNACYSSTRIRVADITTALRSKGVCGAGTCYSDRTAGAYHTNTRLYRFNGSSYSTLKDPNDNNVFFNCGRWGRYVVTLDLGTGKYDIAIYNLGYVGQPMDYDHSSSTLLIATNNLSLAASAIRNVDSVVLFSEGQDNYNGKTTSFNSKALGRFPLFDNVRVCLVNASIPATSNTATACRCRTRRRSSATPTARAPTAGFGAETPTERLAPSTPAGATTWSSSTASAGSGTPRARATPFSPSERSRRTALPSISRRTSAHRSASPATAAVSPASRSAATPTRRAFTARPAARTGAPSRASASASSSAQARTPWDSTQTFSSPSSPSPQRGLRRHLRPPTTSLTRRTGTASA